uniref:Uncharacterized protein n=1 Tax=Gopherus agassizii TaxID=38772 RepID=A0A452HZ19_9SAUR
MDLDSVSSFSSLQALAKLLADPQEEDSDDSDFGSRSSSVSTVGPGNIGPAKKAEPTVTPDVKSGNSKDIWNTEEVPEGSEFDDIWDPREQPEYEILFKQQVGAEDIFLGMSRKNPSTACCEDMLVSMTHISSCFFPFPHCLLQCSTYLHSSSITVLGTMQDLLSRFQ